VSRQCNVAAVRGAPHARPTSEHSHKVAPAIVVRLCNNPPRPKAAIDSLMVCERKRAGTVYILKAMYLVWTEDRN
jgi:hypothetical protein